MKHLAHISKAGLIVALILFLTPSFVNPEVQHSFEQLWEQVESFNNKGLPRSALEKLESIHNKALSEKNQTQLLKATLYRFSLLQSFEENHLIQSIDFAIQTLPLLESPGKEILHSITAELYWFYYQENRYFMLERSNTSIGDETDLREWDIARMRDSIEMHYNLSLRAQTISDTTSTNHFELILEKVPENSWQQQPTLFGFLANRVLEYYTNRDAALQDALPAQKLTDLKLWQTSGNFAAMKLHGIDPTHHRILDLLQQMLASNLRQKQTVPMISNELFRFKYLKDYFEDASLADSLYLHGLQSLQQRTAHHQASTLVAAERASFLTSGQSKFLPDTVAFARAIEICEQAIETYPQSRGASLCKMIKAQLLEASISLMVQRVELPEKPIAARLEYRNVTQPAFRLIRMKSESLASIMEITDQQQRAEAMLRLQPTYEWSIQLPFEADYAAHSTIIDLPPLNKGLYLLLAAADSSFSSKQLAAFTSFQVSRLGFIQQNRNSTNVFYLLDRDSGKALANADIHIMTREYDYQTRSYAIVKRMQLETNRKGIFEVGPHSSLPRNQAFYVEAMTKNDTLYSDNFFDVYERKPNTRVQSKTWFFTDRAIYRPGQTIYFKGIVLEKNGSQADWEIKKQQLSTVRFLDVNRKEIASIKLQTNAFGSFEGSLNIPMNVLTGNMVLSNESGSTQIQVAAYKRPSFEVLLESDHSQTSLNDTIIIHGNAKAFAGFGLDSVEVRYRVEREKQFPYWPWWRSQPPFDGITKQITTGTVYTRADGSFQIHFVALPEASRIEQEHLIYNFSVVADVVDRNGETRNGKLVVPVGSVSLLMQSNVDGDIPKDEMDGFTLSLKNMQQQATNTSVTSRVYRLEESDRLQRPAVFPKTDRFYHRPEKLAQLFPLDQYDLASNIIDRPKALVYEATSFVMGSARAFPDVSVNWPEGSYLIEFVAADDQGREVKLLQTFRLFDKKTKKAPNKQTAWFYLDKSTALPGDTVTLYVASATKGSRVLIEISSGTELRYSSWHPTGNKKMAIPYIVKEEDRGQLQVQAVLVKHNRTHPFNQMIDVPFTNKMLDISLETFRQKITPGAEENWIIHVRAKEKEKVAAELLAAMYDASLDQFVPHNWQFNTLNRKASAPNWIFDNGFLIYYTNPLFPQRPFDVNIPPQHQIRLNWFGLNAYQWRGNGLPMPMMAKSSHDHMHESSHEVALFSVVDDDATPYEVEKDNPPVDEQGAETIIRSDFRETAFFYPQLITDSSGNISIQFKLPDALTRWKLLLLAHTQQLKSGMNTYTFEASKDLMVVPNHARFYREGDTAWLAAKVVNTSTKTLQGIGQLEIRDAVSQLEMNIIQDNPKRAFVNLAPGESRELKWKIILNEATSLLAVTYSASAGVFTDREEQLIPVLPLGIKMVEAFPLMVPAHSKRSFAFKTVKHPAEKEKNLRLSLQLSSNPVWYAIQALPYLNTPENASVEQLFHRYYANSLSSFVANQIPNAMKVIESWKQTGAASLQSQLEKNPELKTVLLAETPWVMDATDEAAQKRALSVLFDINRMQYEGDVALRKLQETQLPDGSWPWFNGMRGNRFTTQNIVLGIGRLMELMPELNQNQQLNQMLFKAMQFLSDEIVKDYLKIKKENRMNVTQIGSAQLDYLFMRTYFKNELDNNELIEAVSFYADKLSENWLKLDVTNQAKAAMVLHRMGKTKVAASILASLKEKSLSSEALGIYWKQQAFGTAAAIESQAMLIAAFDEISGDTLIIDGIRQWLLVNKQTNRWPTAHATAEAVFALINTGTEWVSGQQMVSVVVGGKPLGFAAAESGTAFVEKNWFGDAIQPELGDISLENPNPGMAWGAVFREYTVPLDAVMQHQTTMRIKRDLLLESGTATAPVWIPVEKQAIHTGDKVKVRIVLETDRNMEFVHLRDRRAAAFEPESTLSSYQWSAGLGYFEAVGDLHTDFFFDFLPKGKYVLEYNLIAMQQGNFAHGHASIQSFYAPEFTANSKGLRIQVMQAE